MAKTTTILLSLLMLWVDWAQLGSSSAPHAFMPQLHSPGDSVGLILPEMAQSHSGSCTCPPWGLWLGSKKTYLRSKHSKTPRWKLQDFLRLSLGSQVVLTVWVNQVTKDPRSKGTCISSLSLVEILSLYVWRKGQLGWV